MYDNRKEAATREALGSVTDDYPCVATLEDLFKNDSSAWSAFVTLVDIIDARRKLHSAYGFDSDDDAAIYYAYNVFTDAALEISESIERRYRELNGYNFSFTLDAARKCASRR